MKVKTALVKVKIAHVKVKTALVKVKIALVKEKNAKRRILTKYAITQTLALMELY